MCITINRGVHVTSRPWTNQREVGEAWSFWSKSSVESGDKKNTQKVVSTCEVLWSARLNTSKVTENRIEDRSSQWEATKRSVGLSTARVVDAHRVWYQRRWTATVRHLICVSVWSDVWVWTAEIETVIDIATPRRRLKSFEDRSQLRSCERAHLSSLACKA